MLKDWSNILTITCITIAGSKKPAESATVGRAFVPFMVRRYNVKALILLEEVLWTRLPAVSGRA
jgi:hypothetical protein